MKRIILLAFIILSINSYGQSEKQIDSLNYAHIKIAVPENGKSKIESQFGVPNVKVKSLTTNSKNWWNYHSTYISLENDFIAIDEHSSEISKLNFLEKLVSGDYITVKLKGKSNPDYYQLIKLNEEADEEIRRNVKNTTTKFLKYYKMEGKPFPEFSFVDIKGKEYTNENSFGKTTIIKCWFIKCVACVKEFPELNELVTQYKNDKSIQFISLAFDQSDLLEEFILKKPFLYAVVPEQRDFMERKLGVTAYPTHFIVDKNGMIEKVYSNADNLIEYLMGKYQIKESKIPPPPPPPTKNKNKGK